MMLFDSPSLPMRTDAGAAAIDFYPTPSWLAAAIVERYLPDLGASDVVLEPTCGDGAFLRAIPPGVKAYGVEIDPVLAAAARQTSGRPVIAGDILTVELDEIPTAVVGNPPFSSSFLDGLLDRMHGLLVEGSRMALVLSAHMFQTSRTVARYADAWSIEVDLMPRDVYPRLQRPIVLARFFRGGDRRIIGMAFVREVADFHGFPAAYRAVLDRAKTNAYVAACVKALESIGRPATIAEITEQIVGRQPTRTEFWREAVRRALAQAFVRIAPGTYAMPGWAA